MFSVEQLSSTVSEAGTNVTSDKRLRQSFYNRVDYVIDRIADELEIRHGNSSRTARAEVKYHWHKASGMI